MADSLLPIVRGQVVTSWAADQGMRDIGKKDLAGWLNDKIVSIHHHAKMKLAADR
ncbi:MAG: hypothetical protein KJ589_10070 [Proteobacteria bacterium]|nr:hypothetical protein [Pseudomonadota bacterium]